MYTILHAEDDPVLALLMKKAIEEMSGVHVLVQRENGQDALDYLLLGNRVDLLITDWRMPVLSGIELIAKLRADERFTGLPILLVSSEPGDELRKAIDVGANATLRKPIDTKEFQRTIESLLGLP